MCHGVSHPAMHELNFVKGERSMTPLPCPVVFDEGRVVVVDKPSGVASEVIANAFARKLVHRIDKGTSGLLVLADDARTVQRMHKLMAGGRLERRYLFIAHGALQECTIESDLVRDRGDGLRGSGPLGKRSVTRIEVVATSIVATAGIATLETGRTHQVRIHLAERGHPLVGEPVYVRDHVAAGRSLLESPRLMLHAWRLAFTHPGMHAPVALEAAPPPAFVEVAARLGLRT
jgi:23S rRNA pseudouridine1911/1915/1917 synthase